MHGHGHPLVSLLGTACLGCVALACVSEPPYADALPTLGEGDAVEPISCPAFSLSITQELTGEELVSHERTIGAAWASYVGPGLALFDADEDGDLDVAFGTGMSDTRILANDGSGRLTPRGEPFARAAVVAAGDIDGDHLPELLLGRGEGLSDELVFIASDGFSDSGESIALLDSEGHTTGAAFADLDRDGDLDLAVSRHIEIFDPKDVAAGSEHGGGNQVFTQDRLVFTEQVDALPEGLREATSFQPLWLDADNDRNPDLYWVNDFGWWTHPNALLLGDGTGAFDAPGDTGAELATATMGVSAGDVDGDGILDLWASDAGSPDLLMGLGDGTFYDAGRATGASVPMEEDRISSWGTAIGDLDLDGRPELLAAYGAINFYADTPEETGIMLPSGEEVVDPLNQRSLLLHQLPDGSFRDASAETGFGLSGVQRAVTVADLDLDGVPEVLTTGWLDPDTPLLRVWSVDGGCGTGLTVRIDDGARYTNSVVTAVIGERVVRRPLTPGSAFGSGSLETTLALGADPVVDELTLELPDGTSLTWTDLEPGALIVQPWLE